MKWQSGLLFFHPSHLCICGCACLIVCLYTHKLVYNVLSGILASTSVIFVNENENENGEKRENNKFVNEN